MDVFLNFLTAAILAGTPLLFGTTGAILTERSGNLNLGIEGIMFMGAIGGLATVFLFDIALGGMAVILAIIGAFVFGALAALIYAFLTITLKTQQNVTGLALTIFGVALANFLGQHLGRTQTTFGIITISEGARAGFAPVLFGLNILVFLAVAVALGTWLFFKTRTGLKLRAVGENPATADAMSINVTKYKYLATVIGGGIAGLGGMYISLITTSGVWVHNSVAGFGWIAVALVIFSTWNPARAIFGALVFGAFTVMRFYLPLGIPMQFYDTFPYLVTILVLIVISIKQVKENRAPKSLGLNYFREER